MSVRLHAPTSEAVLRYPDAVHVRSEHTPTP